MQNATPLVVIDVQPGHASAIGQYMVNSLIREIQERLESGAPVFLVYNDEEMSGDTLESVQNFYWENGLSPEQVADCTFIEKQFAELRGWMDAGVPDGEILAAVRAMRARRVWDTRCLPAEMLEEMCPWGLDSGNPIFVSQYLESSALARIRKLDICGGARDECLREVELWMDSLDVHYERLEHLVY